MFRYLVSGWNLFNFILTPVELENILDGFHAVINNAHVPLDYVESSISEYVSTYKELYEHLSKGDKLVWNEHYTLFQQIGLTTNLSLCKYGKVHEYDGKKFYLPDFDEPCVNFAPFTLFNMKDKNGKLSISTRVSYIQYPENTVGLQMSYPKNIQFSMGEDYELLRSTKELGSYQDYLLLKERISKLTKPLQFFLEDKKVRPSVRISKGALEKIESYYYFFSNKCVLDRKVLKNIK